MVTFTEAPPGDVKSGEKIFKTKCARCHTDDEGAGHKQGKSEWFVRKAVWHHGRILLFCCKCKQEHGCYLGREHVVRLLAHP
ncbi:hypothetical protein MLD38_013668 [Melastoma candidum]|uniref:Uncharacterized protein n=1 Tax=Melastoma candidum TaxID=119954 RepID=A0ACB9RBG7_9MYRT|nr:hypothetical protein MLD38_013668 [Melastoma candidum]